MFLEDETTISWLETRKNPSDSMMSGTSSDRCRQLESEAGSTLRYKSRLNIAIEGGIENGGHGSMCGSHFISIDPVLGLL